MRGWALWLIYEMNPLLQAAVIVGVFGVPIYLLACMIFGTAKVNRWLILGVVAIAGVLVALWQRRIGWKARGEEAERRLEEAEEFVDDKRDEVDKLPDVKLDERLGRWSKD